MAGPNSTTIEIDRKLYQVISRRMIMEMMMRQSLKELEASLLRIETGVAWRDLEQDGSAWGPIGACSRERFELLAEVGHFWKTSADMEEALAQAPAMTRKAYLRRLRALRAKFLRKVPTERFLYP